LLEASEGAAVAAEAMSYGGLGGLGIHPFATRGVLTHVIHPLSVLAVWTILRASLVISLALSMGHHIPGCRNGEIAMASDVHDVHATHRRGDEQRRRQERSHLLSTDLNEVESTQCQVSEGVWMNE